MGISRLLKSAFCGALLLSAGALAFDMCQNRQTQHYCNENWGIPRDRMPQVVDEVRNRFLDQSNFNQMRVSSGQLVPIQNQLNGVTVFGMVESAKAHTFDPCSRDVLAAPKNATHFHIIDGHHTAIACKILNGTQLITVIWDTAKNVLSRLANFTGVFQVGLNNRSDKV